MDGHGKNGHAVAEFVSNHLLEVVFRNKNIMIYSLYDRGLRQVIVKMEELLRTPIAQQEMRDILGYPRARAGTMFKSNTKDHPEE